MKSFPNSLNRDIVLYNISERKEDGVDSLIVTSKSRPIGMSGGLVVPPDHQARLKDMLAERNAEYKPIQDVLRSPKNRRQASEEGL